VDKLESELDRLIERRSKAKDKANADADSWRISGYQRQKKIREANRVLWIRYYADLAESFALRSAEFQRRARALEGLE
jgi:hypothetical protein